MSATGAPFQTAIRDTDGVWPNAPGIWSFSSLSEVGECPRRWMLTRARYPQLWERGGYPPRPSIAAVAGSVAHRALEVILGALVAQSCLSGSDPRAVQALRDIGGYSQLLRDTIEDELERLQSNPRAAGRLDAIRERLLTEVPAIRAHVQSVVSRMRLEAPDDAAPGSASRSPGSPLAPGSHAEVELRCEALRLRGRADLIAIDDEGCAITDYKTGPPSERHREQLRLYALLWSRDREINPSGAPARRLLVAYTSHDVPVDPPSPADLETLAAMFSKQIAQAQSDLSQQPPPALPSPQACRACSVRHLCEDYWDAAASASIPSSEPVSFVDCEALIGTRNGPRSWRISIAGQHAPVLLRTATEAPGFAAGDAVRLLGLAISPGEGTSEAVLTMTQFSEVFLLRGPARQPGILAAL